MTEQSLPTPPVYGISPHVLPKPRDWNDRVHLVGYWSLPPKPTVPRLPSVARTSLVRSPSTINPAAIDSQLPADLLSFLYSSTDKQLAALPVVYIGFGSMAGPRVHKIVQKVLTQTVLAHRVVSRLKQQSLYRVVFSYYDVVEDKNEGGEPASISAKEKRKRKREKKRAEFKYDPRYVYHLKTNVPHDELFSRMDVIVHHGGAGTVAT